MGKKKLNHKKYQYHNGIPIPRIYHSKAGEKKSARYLVKCGDCDNSIKIYYGPKDDDTVEIGGVLTSKKEWRKILLPLLEREEKG